MMEPRWQARSAARSSERRAFVLCGRVCALAWLLAPSFAPAQSPPIPLIHAHAHNDYQHKHPLLDALARGFCSVEADIHLVDGQLLVAHDRWQVRPGRTLQALYLDPLHERVRAHGGRVYPAGPEFVLLVEIKGDWKTTYPVLRRLLHRYASMLTSFDGATTQTNALRVVITGNRSPAMLAPESLRYAALDGSLADLDSRLPADLIPWISSNWSQQFKWRGAGPFPEGEKLKLQAILAKAHQQGRRVRFWGAPDQAGFWREMLALGVDVLNTDDLAGMQKFLIENQQGKALR